MYTLVHICQNSSNYTLNMLGIFFGGAYWLFLNKTVKITENKNKKNLNKMEKILWKILLKTNTRRNRKA